MTPRLRPHVQITRQHYRGRRWHVVHDPTSNQFYRLSPIAHQLVGMLDGRRTVEDAWNISLAQHGDGAPTQQEVVELLGQMYNTNLLAVDATPEVDQLLSRGRERIKKRVQQQAIGIMYFRIRLFNPDRYLSWLEPILRPLLNVYGFIAWAAFVLFALVRVLPRWDELVGGFDQAVAPANWGWIAAVFLVVKAIHETGHGVLTKRFGGQVPEFGFMLLVLLPSPYVDASACWAFPSKWRRMAVGAGGMIFELFVASVAAWLWLSSSPGELVHQIAYNAMLTASLSTLLFNANPLMRFDGYYILSDLLEVPNLMQRSTQMLQYLFKRHFYRIKQVNPPSTSGAEQTILVVYGIAALAYRVLLFFGITLYVMGKLFAIGLILAVWTAAAWFILPVGKFVHWLATDHGLDEFRPRAILSSLALLGAAFVLLGVIPLPDHRRAAGVIESTARSGVYFGADGFVVRAHVRIGDQVRKGDPIVTCENPDLVAGLAQARAQLVESEAQERDLTVRSVAGAQVLRDRIRFRRELIEEVGHRIESLVVRAPQDGVIVGSDPGAALGAFAQRGQQLCEVVDPGRLRVVATLSTAEAAPIEEAGSEGVSVQFRLVSGPERVFDARASRLVPAAQARLPHAALGYAGGGTVQTDPRDQAGTAVQGSQFVFYVDDYAPVDAPGGWQGAPGQRVRLRFSLPSRPLLYQWLNRVQKLIQGRADV